MKSFPRGLTLLLLLVMAAFIGHPVNVAAQCSVPSFDLAQTFGVGNGPTAIASADLNADGHVDLVTANTNSNSLSILLGNGAGGFGAATTIPVGTAPTSVAIGDFNGDTKPDLVVVNRDSNTLSILLNSGGGSFTAPVSQFAGISPRYVVVADFNGDSKLDLAVAAFSSNAVLVFSGDGTGGFPTSMGLNAGTGPTSVAIGDLNGDGKLDIAAANYNSSNISILLGNGAGGFAGSATPSFGASLVSVVIADFNTDGKADLGIGGNEGTVMVSFGNGSGSFGPPQTLYGNYRVSHIATADLNHDGKADLVASHWSTNTIAISFGNGDGTFDDPAYYGPGLQPWSVVITDLNHDNKLDIVTVNNASNNVAVLRGDGTGQFSHNQLYNAGPSTRSLVVTDFNNDGKRDIAVAGYSQVVLFTNNGAGRFSPYTFSLQTYPVAIVSADFNSDGFTDLAVANQSNSVTVISGNGSGGFRWGGDYSAGSSPTWLADGDFNSDGHDDLAVTNQTTDSVSILIGTGASSFAPPVSFPAGTRPGFVTAADLNNDGNFDLIVSNPDTDNISVLLGNGAGGFGAPTSFATGDNPSWVAVADVNGDGNNDLAVGSVGTVTVFNGNGLGGFPSATNYSVGISAASVVISDLNGDAKPDLAVGDNTSGNLSILLNSGTGAFGSPTSLPSGGAPSFLAAADFNGDGAPDLAVVNRLLDAFLVGSMTPLLNTCAAALSPPPVPGLVMNDLTVTEGDGGTTNAIVTVNLSQPSNQTVSVSYFTDGDFEDADFGVDFQPTSGRITFAPGQTTRTITIPVIGDTLDEFDETFNVFLAAPLNAPMLDGRAVVTIIDNDPPPGVSIADVSLAEGDSGQTIANFTVNLSTASGKNVVVTYSTMNGSAIAGEDYVAKSGTVTIPSINHSTSVNIPIQVLGDINFEADQTFTVNITADTATVTRAQATGTILNDDAVLQFSNTNYSANESGPVASLTVTRVGNTAKVVSVDYATSDSAGVSNCGIISGNASARCDYEAKFGTLRFASGETSKTLSISLVDDAYAEGNETFNASLLNPVGATIGPLAVVATITITDNESANGSSPLANANFFVRQHYLDFLNREPDAAGLAFWSNQITSCGADQACIDLKRVNVSAAFFLSIEFQETGYLAYRFYKASYGNLSGAPVPITLQEFLPDTQKIGEGVVVGVGSWQTQLENNKQAFATAFVNRSRFLSAYPTSRTPPQFVDALYANAGVASPPAAERSAAIGEFGGAGNTVDAVARGRALRRVAENSTLGQQEFNRAFVLMQYFGYLRRNPNDPPEAGLNFDGYNFWLSKLNQFNGDYVAAEMVKAFITSGEYRQRFVQ